jgi:hypothetical protein
MTLTSEEAQRVHVLSLLKGKPITPAQAAEPLGLTPGLVRRLRVVLRMEGPAAWSAAIGDARRRTSCRNFSAPRSSPRRGGGTRGSTTTTSPRSSPAWRASR